MRKKMNVSRCRVFQKFIDRQVLTIKPRFKISDLYGSCIFVGVWVLVFWFGRDRLFRDPGTFFHTIIGDTILKTAKFPHADCFTFTRYGSDWIVNQWLGECVFAFVHRIAGLDGLLVLAVSLVSILYAYLAFKIERSGMNLMLGVVLLSFSLAAVSHHLHVRPHLFTILFMAVLYSKLCDIDMQRTRETSLVWLIPFFVVWVNIHSGALGGLCTLLIVSAGWTLSRLLGLPNPLQSAKSVFILWGLTALCLLTVFINPYFQELPVTWFRVMRSSAISELIVEHASLLTHIRHGDPKIYLTMAAIFCLAAFYFALLIGTEWRDRRVTWYIPLIWLILSLSRIRHAPLFSVVALLAMAEMFPYCGWVKALGKRGCVTFQPRGQNQARPIPPGYKYTIPVLIMALSFFACVGSNQLPSGAQKWARLDATYWPVEVLPELKLMEKASPRGTPIFNDMLFGGFLIYHTPGFRVFIDDRCDLYMENFLLRYVKAEKSDFEAWTKQYRFNIALLETNSNYQKYFEADPDWLIVKKCRSAVLYRKTLE